MPGGAGRGVGATLTSELGSDQPAPPATSGLRM